jgi:hypothetical protein
MNAKNSHLRLRSWLSSEDSSHVLHEAVSLGSAFDRAFEYPSKAKTQHHNCMDAGIIVDLYHEFATRSRVATKIRCLFLVTLPLLQDENEEKKLIGKEQLLMSVTTCDVSRSIPAIAIDTNDFLPI